MCWITRTRKLCIEEPIYVSSKLATPKSQDGHIDFYELMKRLRTHALEYKGIKVYIY